MSTTPHNSQSHRAADFRASVCERHGAESHIMLAELSRRDLAAKEWVRDWFEANTGKSARKAD